MPGYPWIAGDPKHSFAYLDLFGLSQLILSLLHLMACSCFCPFSTKAKMENLTVQEAVEVELKDTVACFGCFGMLWVYCKK